MLQRHTPVAKNEIVKFSEGVSDKFAANDCFIEKDQRRSFIGAVNYLSANTRPDLAWAVCDLEASKRRVRAIF